MPALSTSLNIDLTSVRNAISGQVDLLDTLKEGVEDLLANPPDGIGGLASVLGTLTLPTPSGNQPNAIGDGIASIQSIVPTDLAGAIGPLATSLDAFFADLGGRLSIPLTGGFGLYTATERLLTMEWSLQAGAKGGMRVGRGALLPEMARRGMAKGPSDGILAEIASWRAVLDRIPDPLTLTVLLEGAHSGLAAMPRQLYPLRYMPLLDDLRDKLDTVQTWRQLNANQLVARLAQTATQLSDYLYRAMVVNGVGSVADRVTDLTDAMRPEALRENASTLAQTLNDLATALGNGDPSGLDTAVQRLNEQKTALDEQLTALSALALAEQVNALHRKMGRLGQDLEVQLLEVFASLNPPQDVAFLNQWLAPLNELLSSTGLSPFIGRLRDLFEQLKGWLDQLNLAEIAGAVGSIGTDATQAVEELKTKLLQTVGELSGWMNTARQTLNGLPIQDLHTAVGEGLTTFQTAVDEQVNNIFGPVRLVLSDGLGEAVVLTGQFNPAAVIEQFEIIIAQLSSVLAGPEVLGVLQSVRQTIDDVNGKVAGFSIKVASDPVVDVIGVVKDALGIAASLPLTDSLREDLKKALEPLKPTDQIRVLLSAISGEIKGQVQVYTAPNSVFAQFGEKMQDVQEKVREYSPAHFIGENLLEPYNALLDKLAEYEPKALLRPVDTALSNLRGQLERQANPAQLFAALEGPFNQMQQAINQFQPGALVLPLTQRFEQGVDQLTDSLPTAAIGEVFDQVKSVTDAIQRTVDTSRALRDLLGDLLTKIEPLSSADAQMAAIADELTGKLTQATDFEPFEIALNQVARTIEGLREAPLSLVLSDALDDAETRLATVSASQRLAELSAARNRFTPALMAGLPNSPAKTALQNFLDGFQPLDAAYTAPFAVLNTWHNKLLAYRQSLPTVFEGWDNKWHGATSPFHDLLLADPSRENVRALLADAIRKQVLETFRPVFLAVGHVQHLVAALLGEVEQLIAHFEEQMTQLLAAAQSVQGLKDAVDDLLDSIKALDFSFIATTLQATYDDLKNLLQSLHPATFKAQVDQAFRALLAHLDVNTLLGLDALNTQYQQLIQNLRVSNTSGKSLDAVLEQLQDSFQPVEDLVLQLDISANIQAFFEGILRFLDELELELKRILDAYQEMFDAKTEVSAKVSVSIS